MIQQLKKTIPLAIPIIVGQVGQMMMNFLDSAMVGRIGATYLAASSFANIVFNIPYVFLIGITVSISVLVSQNVGAGRTRECGVYLWNGIILSMGCTFLILLSMLYLSSHLEVFREPEEVTRLARPFFALLIWSFVPMCVFQCLKQFSDGLHMTKPATVCLLTGIVVNVVINYFLIYGNFGAPRLELVGAGIGTLVARTVSALMLLGYILKSDRYKPYRASLRESIDRLKIVKTFKIGLPSGAQYLFEVGAFAGAGLLVGWVGTEELAAHQIALTLASLTFMFAMGLSVASSIRAGNAFGAGDLNEVKEIGKSSFVLVLCMMGFFGLMFFIFKDSLPTLFVRESGVIAFASQLLIIAAIFQLFDGVQAVGLGLLRGMSDVKAPTILTFIAYWVVGLPMAYLLAFHYEMRHIGVWIGLAFSLLVSASLLSFRFFKLIRSRLDAQHPSPDLV